MKIIMNFFSAELLRIQWAGETVEPSPNGPLYITLGCTTAPEESHDGQRSRSEPFRQRHDEHGHTVSGEELAGRPSLNAMYPIILALGVFGRFFFFKNVVYLDSSVLLNESSVVIWTVNLVDGSVVSAPDYWLAMQGPRFDSKIVNDGNN